ncbi:substrate-binding periplasmic protein [Chitinilyticum litopenaei]|uniref:substrate-binding periplasmic protein n=1 Tax=Chitinilyticum litopenaei TaxID=1121276 RepID=UPI00040B701C|nr:transporter substrate-binding domain-containing protein [Chitinilyticum litopenaei]
MRILLWAGLLLAGLASQGQAAGTGCSKPFNMAMEKWSPYVYYDEAGKPAGLDIELVQAIFREAGCTLRIDPEAPRLRRQHMHVQGELALLVAASKTPERESHSWFTLPYRQETTCLCTLSSNQALYGKLQGFADVLQQGITVVSPNSGFYGADYAKNLAAMKAAGIIWHFEDFRQGLRMLKARRAELIVGDLAAVMAEAKKQNMTVSSLPFVPVNDPVHLMLSRKSATAEDIATLNAAISRLEKNGTLAGIRARYGIK